MCDLMKKDSSNLVVFLRYCLYWMYAKLERKLLNLLTVGKYGKEMII